MTRKILRRTPCVHIHLSGRQCGRSAPPSIPLCGFHKSGSCSECQTMLDNFQPPNGWPRGVGVSK